ncbi:hypothetical protein EMIT0111MI5_80307 [Burkholderia sp. IT-111MI5]
MAPEISRRFSDSVHGAGAREAPNRAVLAACWRDGARDRDYKLPSMNLAFRQPSFSRGCVNNERKAIAINNSMNNPAHY